MKRQKSALAVLCFASALIVGVAGTAEAGMVASIRSARPTPSPAAGARPQPREARETWARSSADVGAF